MIVYLTIYNLKAYTEIYRQKYYILRPAKTSE